MNYGWIPDLPDVRDYSVRTNCVAEGLITVSRGFMGATRCNTVGPLRADDLESIELPGKVDLRQWCSPVQSQGSLGSCTAQAAASLVEHYENRAHGTYIDASRLFIYKTARKMLGWTGDTGAYIRTTMGALTLFGAPPERYWPYETAEFEKEPSPFCYALAQNYQAVQYYRLDVPGTNRTDLLRWLRAEVAHGLPFMFGFTVYESIRKQQGGKIPFPRQGERVLGGHAVMVAGYDDGMLINNGEDATTGALLIQNSWGTGWGDSGFGYLPYRYVMEWQARDFWALMKAEWVDTGRFGL